MGIISLLLRLKLDSYNKNMELNMVLVPEISYDFIHFGKLEPISS